MVVVAPFTSAGGDHRVVTPAKGPQVQQTQTVFSCSIARHEGDVDIELIGEIDRSSAGQFRNQLLTLAKEHPASIAIHMDDLALIDSSCVAVLVETWRFTQEHGIELTVKSPAASIRQVFDVAESGRLLTLRH
jgi:anti-anti-sigma factor